MQPTIEQFYHSIYRHRSKADWIYAVRIDKSQQPAKPYKSWIQDWNPIAQAAKSPKPGDLYFSPAFYSRSTRPIKANCRGAGTVWVDCDGDIPSWNQRPNFVIETSPGHIHAYWLLSSFENASRIEAINRSLTYQYRTDKSGWDCVQLLRPPGSLNRKRSDFPSRIIEWNPDYLADFSEIQAHVEQSEDISETSKTVYEVLAGLVAPRKVHDILFRKTESNNGEGRSGVYYELACEVAKLGLPDDEILILLEYLDTRLKKFADRVDKKTALQGIVRSARVGTKIPSPTETKRVASFRTYIGHDQIIAAAPSEGAKFIVPKFLPESAIIVIGGQPGSWKSRLCLYMMMCIATGSSFLKEKVTTPRKVAYLSLDMRDDLVTGIYQRQATGFSPSLLNQNVALWLKGFSWDLTQPQSQEELEEAIDGFGAEVIIMDAISQAVEDSSEGPPVKKLLDWIQSQNKTWILISHPRKSPASNSKSIQDYTLDSLLGSRYWSIPADTVLMMEKIKPTELKMYAVKDRHGVFMDQLNINVDTSNSSFHLGKITGQQEVIDQPSKGKQLMDDT